MLDELRTQWSDIDPRAGGKLEVLGDTPAEEEPVLRMGGIFKGEGVAQPVVALVVERSTRDLGLAPVAGCDVGAFDARLVLAFERDELQIHSGRR